jgi:hypothetical protein
MMIVRVTLLLPLLVVLSACQLIEPREGVADPEEPEPAPRVTEVTAAEDDPGRLARAMEYLQDGAVEKAEALLAEHLVEHPGNALATRLMRQIREEPQLLLGEDFDYIVVQPGDTLSQLAARHAGDGMLFFALARLNDIERPRLLRPGMEIQVPAADPGIEPADVEDTRVEPDATVMLAEGEARQAVEQLLLAAQQRELEADEKSLLGQAAVMSSEENLEAGELDEAEAVILAVQRHARIDDASMIAQHERILARVDMGRAEAAMMEGDQKVARDLLQSALDRDPSLIDPIRNQDGMRAALVEGYHDRALKAWRNHEVETAIDYWERVVEIDPEFTPAQVYLERGREVLRRLEAL